MAFVTPPDPTATAAHLSAMAHPLYPRVEAALETIREYLRTDGCYVRIQTITNDAVVELELLGACSSCSMSTMTMKAGVEQAILRAVPEVTAVRTVR